jgi:hypothetical protein
MHNLFGDKYDQIVILDTCVLIDIFADSEGISHYQRYIYQSLLPLVSNKKIFISATTKQELINTMDKNDSITNLLKNKDFIKSDDELIQLATIKFWNNIQQDNKPQGKTKEENIKNDITNCFTAKHYNAVLVSSEKMQKGRIGNQTLKIPSICKKENIKFMKTIEFLYILGVNTQHITTNQNSLNP